MSSSSINGAIGAKWDEMEPDPVLTDEEKLNHVAHDEEAKEIPGGGTLNLGEDVLPDQKF